MFGVSGRPSTWGSDTNYQTSVVQEVIDFLNLKGLNCYRMCFFVGTPEQTIKTCVDYYLNNCNHKLVLNYYHNTGNLVNWADSTTLALSLLNYFSASQDRIIIEPYNQYPQSFVDIQNFVNAIRNAGFTSKIYCSRWYTQDPQYFINIFDPLYTHIICGQQQYMNAIGLNGAISRTQTFLNAGVEVLDGEVGAHVAEYPSFTQSLVNDVNSYLAWADANGVSALVWMLQGMRNYYVTSQTSYENLGLAFADIPPPEPQIILPTINGIWMQPEQPTIANCEFLKAKSIQNIYLQAGDLTANGTINETYSVAYPVSIANAQGTGLKIYGWLTGFNYMDLTTPESRAAIINNIVAFCNQYGFNGIASDVERWHPFDLWITFHNELTAALHANGKEHIAAVLAYWIYDGFTNEQIAALNVDRIQPMLYDINAGEDKTVIQQVINKLLTYATSPIGLAVANPSGNWQTPISTTLSWIDEQLKNSPPDKYEGIDIFWFSNTTAEVWQTWQNYINNPPVEPPPPPPKRTLAARVPMFGNSALIQYYARKARDKIISKELHKKLHPIV